MMPVPRNARLDHELYQRSGHPCAFTIRCAPERAPFRQERFARIAVTCLLEQQRKSSCRLAVYCVMPDHIHVIVTPEHDGASTLAYVDRFKGWCGRELRVAGWSGDVWQSRSYDHVVRGDEDLLVLCAYILANPIRAGLASEPDEYQWSGMPGLEP